MVSAQESCTATDTTTQGRQGNTSVSNLAVVNAAGSDAIGMAVAGRHLQASQNEYYGNYAGMAKRGALTHEQAAGLAGLDALRYSGRDFNRSASDVAGDQNTLIGLVGRAGLSSPGDASDPMRNAVLETPNVSGLREATAGAGAGASHVAGVRGAVGADHSSREGVVSSGMNNVYGADGDGAYAGLAKHDAAAARVAHLDKSIHEQNSQLDNMLLRGENRNFGGHRRQREVALFSRRPAHGQRHGQGWLL